MADSKDDSSWAGLLALGCLAASTARADPAQQPKPLPEKIVQTWREAGAVVGWLRLERGGRLTFVAADFRSAGALPGFRFAAWKDGALAKLPDPGQPFGVDLGGTEVTDPG